MKINPLQPHPHSMRLAKIISEMVICLVSLALIVFPVTSSDFNFSMGNV